MDDDSCEFKYIEIVPLDNSVEQTEDLKPFEVKVCFIRNLVNHESKQWSSHSSGSISCLRCERSQDQTHTVYSSVVTKIYRDVQLCFMVCIFTAAPRLTELFTLQRMVNECRPYG